ncbi:MAG: GNAT family N-acetyltransferase [Candidatus Bipolaricaulis sp.]|nr:GNAT family N-acetyltransferase [Candidatus Bipolaricaulis sp.]
MAVTLREITMNNFIECIGLRVGEAQKNCVASNMHSLAEAKADKVSNPFVIYGDKQMVGFIMYDYTIGEHRGYLSRLMIDARFQGKGYARAALAEVMERLERMPGIRDIQTSFDPENHAAESLYASFGLARTGELVDGEVIVRLKLAEQRASPRGRSDSANSACRKYAFDR